MDVRTRRFVDYLDTEAKNLKDPNAILAVFPDDNQIVIRFSKGLKTITHKILKQEIEHALPSPEWMAKEVLRKLYWKMESST